MFKRFCITDGANEISTDAGAPLKVAVNAKMLVLVFLAALLFSAVTVSFVNTDCAYASQKTHKIVMIGDSYAVKSAKHKVKVPWPERVRKLLGISVKNCKIYRKSGYGFARNKYKFLQLLKKAKRDKKVTDVLIVGGIGNDRFVSRATVRKYYRLTIKRLRYLYPNATIMHAITNWDYYRDYFNDAISARYTLYQSLAEKYGVTYLYGCETVLYNNRSYFSPDLHHANDKGQAAMAKVIVKKIKKFNPHYKKSSSKTSSTASSTSSTSASSTSTSSTSTANKLRAA